MRRPEASLVDRLRQPRRNLGTGQSFNVPFLLADAEEAANEIEALSATVDGCDELLARYDQLLASIWLYIDWRYVTRQLTTEQKELFADAVQAGSADPDDPISDEAVDRWWR